MRVLHVLMMLLLLVAPCAAAAEEELRWDDGTQAGKQSLAGTGHGIRFETPKRMRWIRSIRIHGARYGGGYDPAKTFFDLALCGEDLEPLHVMRVPYASFKAGAFGWVEIGLDVTFELPERFAVVAAFDPARTRGVYVGWTATEATHSFQGLPGGEAHPAVAGREWMIRATVSKKPPKGVPRLVEVRVDDGVQIGERSLGGSAHAVTLKRPSGSWWLQEVRVFGKRYGGGYDPAATRLRVDVEDDRSRVLAGGTAPYARFKTGAFAWVDVPCLSAKKLPSKFRVVVDFAPTQTKGVYLAYTQRAKRGASSIGRSGAPGKTFGDGEWMIRAVLVDHAPAEAERTPSAPAAADAARAQKDFQAIARIVRRSFPAFEKKGVDWKKVCREFEPLFRSAPSDAQHVLLAHRLLARLKDTHSGVIAKKVEAHVPAFDGLYGAGLWIAAERGRLLLRAALPGQAAVEDVAPGSLLTRIGGRSAADVHQETTTQVATWYGWSSDAFRDARLSFQFFPFGEARTLDATFFDPATGEETTVTLPRWGPGGRGLSRVALTMPEGVEAEGKAVSTRLEGDLGYVRILGSMDEATKKAFFEAVDALRGVKGILLDARGMGGGGDRPAWAMAGRFFEDGYKLPNDPDLVPTGSWQFDGPVVLLQDERMISSAETFTWAMVETGRALAVGRPTGGATIIPRVFDVPSGLFRFRLGCRDRETSVEGVHPEGLGSPPDVFVPYDAWLLREHDDPIRAVGLDLLRRRVLGQDPDVVARVYGGVLGAQPDRLDADVLEAFSDLAVPPGQRVDFDPEGVVRRMIEEEIVVHGSEAIPKPDVEGARVRLGRLASVADLLGLDALAARARAAFRDGVDAGDGGGR